MSRVRSLGSISIPALAIALLLTACTARAPETKPATAATAVAAQPTAPAAPAPVEPIRELTYPDCPSEPFCDGTCTNTPYRPTICNTTTYGPAKADVVLAPTNLIMCSGGSYALCFFSGPPKPTGTNPNNPALPCVLNDEHPDVADCSCPVFTGGVWFVDINGILNLGAWYQTIALEQCGPTGELCQNLAACGPDGSKCAGTKLRVPDVCAYIQNQAPDNEANSLLPRADLISTFSFALADDYSMNPQTDCTQVPDPRYAGCMTAPCFYPPGTPEPPPPGTIAQCQCPTYQGPFQIGQTITGIAAKDCQIDHAAGVGYVWSASYNPFAKSSDPTGN